MAEAVRMEGGRRPRPVLPRDLLEGLVTKNTRPLMRSELRHDPRPALTSLAVPLLAVNGDKDLWVPADQNVPAIREAVAKGGNPDATVTVLKGLTHSFQKSQDGIHPQTEDTIDPAVLDLVANWLGDRFSGDRGSQNGAETERTGKSKRDTQ